MISKSNFYFLWAINSSDSTIVTQGVLSRIDSLLPYCSDSQSGKPYIIIITFVTKLRIIAMLPPEKLARSPCSHYRSPKI